MADETRINQLAEEQAGKFVRDRWQEHLTNTRHFNKRLVNWYKQYRGISTRRNYPGIANVVVNETLAAVESITAQIYQTLRSDPKLFWGKPGEETDAKQVELAEDLVWGSLVNMGFDSKLLRHIRQAVKYGTTVAKIFRRFNTDRVMRRRTIEDFGVMGSELGEEEVVTYDDCDLEYMDLLDVGMDPGKPTIDLMDWIIFRRRVSYDDIIEKARRGVYGNIDKVPKQGKAPSEKYYKDERLRQVGINEATKFSGNLELLEMWGLAPLWWVSEDVSVNSPEAEHLVQTVIEVVNESSPIVVRQESNPYWHKKKPALMGHYIAVDDEAYGIGVCEILESAQQELNDKRNQALDAVTFKIFPVLEKLRQANIDPKDVMFLPKRIINSDVKGGITPINMVGEVGSANLLESVVKQDMRHQSGATAPVQGIKEKGEQTAFEINTLETRGASRINIATIDFANNFLRPLYSMAYKMHQQFTDRDKVIARVGKKGIRWVKFAPQDVAIDFDFIPIVPTDINNRAIVISQMIQFIGQIARYYPQTSAYRLVRKIYTMFGFEDVDDVIPEPDLEKGQGDLTQEEEIVLLEMGQKIDVKYWENHFQKIAVLIPYLEQNRDRLTQKAMDAFGDKISQHQRYLTNLAQVSGGMEMGVPGVPGAQGAGRGQIEAPQFLKSAIQPQTTLQRRVVSPMGG